jgi:hypothetical protein
MAYICYNGGMPCEELTPMKRTMIYLPDEIHQGLRRLAFEANTSIAELIRKAVQAVYGEDIEDIEDIRDAEGGTAKYLPNASRAVSLDELGHHKTANA